MGLFSGAGKGAKIFSIVTTTTTVGLAAGLIVSIVKKPKQVSVDGFAVTYIDSNNDQMLSKQNNMIYASKPNAYTFTNGVDKYKSKISHWYIDRGLTSEFNFSTKLSGDISLYCKWESSHYSYVVHNVGADESEKNPLASGKVAHTNSTISKGALTAPEISRKRFNSWYLSKDYKEETKMEFPYKIEKDVHIWPKYEQTHTLITFFECTQESITTPIEDKTRVIPEPTKDAYKFKGWTVRNETGFDVYSDAKQKIVHLNKGDSTIDGETGEDYLKCKFLCDSIDLNANWEQSAFDVAFYSTADASGQALKTFSKKETITKDDVKDLVPTNIPDDRHFYGWILSTASEKDKKDKTKAINFEDGVAITGKTNFVPVFAPADYTVKVNMNGGYWEKDGASTKCDNTYDIDVWNDVKMTSADILNRVKIAAGKKDYKLIGSGLTPNYKAFSITGEAALITDGVIIGENQTIEAVYNDASHFTVTFDADGGSFVYEDSTGGLVSSEIISYTAELTANKTKWTLKELYDAAIAEKTNCKIEKDGYLLSASTVSSLHYSGWLLSGVSIPDTYEFTEGAAFTADWVEETPTDFWKDGWTTVSNLANRGITEFHDKYWKAYQSNTADGTQTGNLKWGNGDLDNKQAYDGNETHGSFIGLEKDISLTGYGTFKTRIISQEEDILTQDENKTVAFTFDFIEMPTIASIGKSNDYANGYIPNNYIPLLKYAIPTGLRANLKQVHKPVLKSKTSSPYYEATYIDTDMFIPSTHEVNGGTVAQTNKQGTVYNSSAYVESLAFSSSKYLLNYQWYKYQYDLTYSTQTKPKSVNRTVLDLSDTESTTSNKHYRAKKFTYYDKSKGEFVTENSSWLLRTPTIASYYSAYGSTDNEICSFYVCDAGETVSKGKPYLGGIYNYFSSDARCLSLCFCI